MYVLRSKTPWADFLSNFGLSMVTKHIAVLKTKSLPRITY
jgi:hypothetical protein